MRTSRRRLWIIGIAAIVATAVPGQVLSQTAAVRSPAKSRGSVTHWSVQLDRVEPGDRDVPHAFQVAIYENLVQELKGLIREESLAAMAPEIKDRGLSGFGMKVGPKGVGEIF